MSSVRLLATAGAAGFFLLASMFFADAAVAGPTAVHPTVGVSATASTSGSPGAGTNDKSGSFNWATFAGGFASGAVPAAIIAALTTSHREKATARRTDRDRAVAAANDAGDALSAAGRGLTAARSAQGDNYDPKALNDLVVSALNAVHLFQARVKDATAVLGREKTVQPLENSVTERLKATVTAIPSAPDKAEHEVSGLADAIQKVQVEMTSLRVARGGRR